MKREVVYLAILLFFVAIFVIFNYIYDIMRMRGKSKYNNRFVYVVVDKNGVQYPFEVKSLAEVFAEQEGLLKKDIIRFDSKLEYGRYKFLKDLEEKGVIEDLKTQEVFPLIPNQSGEKITILGNGMIAKEKKKMRATNYRADFTYKYLGQYIVEDTKSPITRKKPDYVIKKKLMLKEHGIFIKEVNRRCINKL